MSRNGRVLFSFLFSQKVACCLYCSFHLIKLPYFKKDFTYLILERGERREEERERNIHVREKHLLVASCMCSNRGLNPQPRPLS